jgi:copper chaperone
MEKLTERLEIEGMTCGGCIRHVRSALVGMNGVEIEDMSIGSAEIAYDPSKTTREEIIETIREQGYAVR